MDKFITYQFIYKQNQIDTLSTDSYQDALDFQAHIADIMGVELEEVAIIEQIEK